MRSLVVVGQVFVRQTLVADILKYLHQTVTVQVELHSYNIKQLVKQYKINKIEFLTVVIGNPFQHIKTSIHIR